MCSDGPDQSQILCMLSHTQRLIHEFPRGLRKVRFISLPKNNVFWRQPCDYVYRALRLWSGPSPLIHQVRENGFDLITSTQHTVFHYCILYSHQLDSLDHEGQLV